MTRLSAAIAVTALIILGSCGGAPDAPQMSNEPIALWNHRPEARAWTGASLAALDDHGAPLVKMVPEDIDTYCPGYRTATETERKAFWVMFLSALAKHESTWRPDAAGGGGAWLGLLQISPQTAQGYGCRARTAQELKNGSLNLSCGIRIMAVTVPRDGVISEGMRGVAADWGPFHQASKRSDIQAVTRAQPFCEA